MTVGDLEALPRSGNARIDAEGRNLASGIAAQAF